MPPLPTRGSKNCPPPEERRKRKGPGRVRSEAARQAVLAATWDLVGETGFSRLTMEKIAARADVSKATVYRWWSNRASVAMDALLERALIEVPFPDSGDAVQDICENLRAVVAFLNSENAGHIIAGLVADAQHDPDLAEEFRTSFVLDRGLQGHAMLQRGVERGELRDDIDLAVVGDVLVGPVYYRLLIGDGQLNADYTAELVRILFDGLRRHPRTADEE
jgi:AcrR family transcriptional regulator